MENYLLFFLYGIYEADEDDHIICILQIYGNKQLKYFIIYFNLFCICIHLKAMHLIGQLMSGQLKVYHSAQTLSDEQQLFCTPKYDLSK